ncbi:glycosyltransferase [Sulfitobacter sp. F26204]|uniref:glycosyltransferase n=1 Tax=Sulfitobacter sp. F26204 TaxID=2996014 RepID=UPI00225E25B9|nr:glycosyltransferase [Sulfitobacter sp. F26204]MCX7560430.1 glycosyltransferase [Sulfitobacter sp. F26204]
MHLAFYAPMKSPNHPVPSGDRSIAQSLIVALNFLGAEVSVASELRSRDGTGDSAVQAQLKCRAETEIQRLIKLGEIANWQAWITYHNYYKAPDLLGPEVSRALGIPYLQVESTRARKRLTGTWSSFAEAAEQAADAAQVIFYFSTRDAIGLRQYAKPQQRFIHLRPFLPIQETPYASVGSGPMLSVGMMRAGDKLASYKIIAETLGLLTTTDWQLQIAGDGPARPQVEEMMAPFHGQVNFLGQLDLETLKSIYQSASLFFWPGVNEALGMVYLEAQSVGLPVVAQDRPGMREVLAPADYPAPSDGASTLAALLDELLCDPLKLKTAGQIARSYISNNHLMPSAADTLRAGLAHVGVTK